MVFVHFHWPLSTLGARLSGGEYGEDGGLFPYILTSIFHTENKSMFHSEGSSGEYNIFSYT